MDWNNIVERVAPHVVKIETPDGHGTGFLFRYSENEEIAGIATAHHVVKKAHKWQQPIHIRPQESDKNVVAEANNRAIFIDLTRDSAAILIHTNNIQLPKQPFPLLPASQRLPIGVDVGWLGYPSIAPDVQCFFSGRISASKDAYLIDGVAINGVSGGPVICSTPTDGIQIVGLITQYWPNRSAEHGILPGLSLAQDVSHLHAMTSHFKSIDEAIRANAQAMRNAEPAQALDDNKM